MNYIITFELSLNMMAQKKTKKTIMDGFKLVHNKYTVFYMGGTVAL